MDLTFALALAALLFACASALAADELKPVFLFVALCKFSHFPAKRKSQKSTNTLLPVIIRFWEQLCGPALARGFARTGAAVARRVAVSSAAWASLCVTLAHEKAALGFINAPGLSTLAGPAWQVLCRLFSPLLLPARRLLARLFLSAWSLGSSWLVARLEDLAGFVCVDKERLERRRRNLRLRELALDEQWKTLVALEKLVDEMSQKVVRELARLCQRSGQEYEHLRPAAFSHRVAFVRPEQGPVQVPGLWFRLRHLIDVDTLVLDQFIARLETAMNRNRGAVAVLEQRKAVRARELQAIDEQWLMSVLLDYPRETPRERAARIALLIPNRRPQDWIREPVPALPAPPPPSSSSLVEPTPSTQEPHLLLPPPPSTTSHSSGPAASPSRSVRSSSRPSSRLARRNLGDRLQAKLERSAA
ncbi:hypothetical protein VTJ49DRAFT_239 [Mycothermus thermophilus]|uniref:Uncharacterized protein n=1 Tax=Humicola insolens TaxID=85995 RepID=A0ABR3VHP7_HUMIN